MKRALVLSGGGALGAFQFGALRFIHDAAMKKLPTYGYRIVSGVSVGALNGAMWAMNKFEALRGIWENIRWEDLFRGSLSILPALGRLLCGKKSVLDNGPLRRMLERHVRPEDFGPDVDFRFGVVSLTDGEYRSFKAGEFSDSRELVRGILASTSIPVLWEPVGKVRAGEKAAEHLVDGGVRNVSPLGDVIDDDPDEIVIVSCYARSLNPEPRAADTIFTIAKRTIVDIGIHEIFRTDIREFLHINRIIAQLPPGVKVKKPHTPGCYKAFRFILIEPDHDLGDPLDFSRDVIRKRIEKGQEIAKREFERFYPDVSFE